jgi:outer membrane protein TolC
MFEFGFVSNFEFRISNVLPHALFDEMNPIPHSSPTMRRPLGILLALMAATLAVFSQTNPPANSRELSLQDCIELALKHNLALKIDRYNPELQLFGLDAYYGYYDPTLTLSGQHDQSLSGEQLLSGGFSVAGSKRDDDSFDAALNGYLPSGATYTLGTLSPLVNAYGVSGTTVNDTNNPLFATSTPVVIFSNGVPVSSGTIVRTNFAQVAGIAPFESSGGNVGITVSQPLLKNFWIDAPRLNIQVAKNRLQYSEITLRLNIITTITTLEQAYFDLIYYRENVLVQEKAVELAERLVAENRKKLEVGTLAPLDLQSAEAQAASSRAAVIQARSQLGTQERAVKQLITDSYREWADVELVPAGTLTAQPPIVNLQDSWSKGLTQRPELLQAKLDVEQAGIQLKYDRNQLFPQLDVFATAGYAGAGKEFSDALHNIEERNLPFYTYGGRLVFPLSNAAARNNYKAGKATLEQKVLTLKSLEQQVMIDIDNDIGNIRAGYDQVIANRAAREYQEAALDAEQKKLESGKSTTYTVLQVQRDLTTARGAEIQALDTYNKSLSQLSLHEGSTLERLGIKFEVK